MKFRFTIASLVFLLGTLPGIADTVRINKTGTTYQNVKTTEENGIVTVDFEDGSQKRFRSKDVTVTKSEVVWLAQEKEEPSFWERWFGGSKPEPTPQETTTATAVDSDSEEPSIPYLAEGIFGGVALLFFLLP